MKDWSLLRCRFLVSGYTPNEESDLTVEEAFYAAHESLVDLFRK